VHFSAKQIRADRLGAVTRYRERHYATPALLPTMSRLPAAPPSAPRLVATAGTTLAWQAGEREPVSWALYRVGGAAADLVATGRRGAPVTPPGPGTYCLSGLDRSGNEGPLSAPVTITGAG
jgi:hypothetical protein